MKKYQSLLAILIGAFFIYWAQTHSPNAGIGSVIKNELSGSYTMSEFGYYATLGVGALLVIAGVIKFIKK